MNSKPKECINRNCTNVFYVIPDKTHMCLQYHQYRKAAERLKMTNKTYTANVQLDPENGEDYVLTFPDELLKEMGWEIGDTLVWEETTISEDHGEVTGFTLRKKDD